MLEDPQRTPNSKNDGDNFPHLYSTVNSNKNLINQAQGLVGYWSFDEGSGNIARDYSGNGNNGTLLNSTSWTIGKVGNAIINTSAGTDVEIPRTPILNPTSPNLTIAAWIKVYNYAPSNTCQTIVEGSGNLNLRTGYYLGFHECAGDYLKFKAGNGSIWAAAPDFSQSNIPINEWVFVAGVLTPSKVSLYLNGELKTSSSHSLGSISYENYPIRIGSLSYISRLGYPLNGLIDEVRIYNRALSDSEIKALYEATK